MISVEQKLSVFTQYLLKKQREAGTAIIESSKRKRDEMMADTEERLQADRRSIEERNYHVIYRDKNKIIADGKNVAKKQLLQEHNRVLEDFKITIWQEAREYLDKPAYTQYLERCLNRVPTVFGDRKILNIYTTASDRAKVKQLVDQILSGYTVTYEDTASNVIGGLIIRDADNRINCDFTMANLVRDNTKTIGMRLNEIMDKQVTTE